LRATSYSFARSEFDAYYILEGHKYINLAVLDNRSSNFTTTTTTSFSLQFARDLCRIQHQYCGDELLNSINNNAAMDVNAISDVDELLSIFTMNSAEKTVLLLDGFDLELFPELGSLLDTIMRKQRDKNFRIVLTTIRIPTTFEIAKVCCTRMHTFCRF
jgi:hypothetical protein